MKWLTMSELSHGLEVETGIALAGVVLALVICSIATLVLFLSVKREVQRLAWRERRRTDRQLEAFKESLENLDRENQNLQKRPAYLELAGTLLPTAGDQALQRISDGFGEEMGLVKRAQGLKRLRAGEPPEDVAREVEAPLCEIQLLARVEERLRDVRERRNAETTNADAVAGTDVATSGASSTKFNDRNRVADPTGSPTDDPRPAAIPRPRARRAKAGAGKD